MKDGEIRRRIAARNLALYHQYKEWLVEQEEAATSCGAVDFTKPMVQAQAVSRVEIAAEKLIKARMGYRAWIVDSIDMARNVFDDYVDSNKRYKSSEKEIIKQAVWMSAMNPYANPYESFNRRTMPISRSAFHWYRKKLLDKIADMAGI